MTGPTVIERLSPDRDVPIAAVPGMTVFSPGRRAAMLAVLFLISTSSYLDRMIMAVALEPIKREFHASDTLLGALSGFFFAIFYGTLAVPVALWADRGDRRFIVTAALSVWSLMTAFCGLASGLWHLVLARIGVGAGESGAMAPAQSLIGDVFPPGQRGRAISIFMLSLTAGNFLGLAGGGWITQVFGWRSMFLIAGISGIVLVPVAWLVLREPRAIATVSQSRATFGTTARILWDKRSYRLTTAAVVMFFIVSYGPLAFTVPFLIRVHNLSVGEAGGLFGALTAVAGLVGNLASGALSDRLIRRDTRWGLWLPAAILPILFFCYLTAFLATSLSHATIGLFLGGMLFAAAFPPIYSSLHAVCGSERRTTAFALALSAANLLGLSIGPVGVGLLSDFFAPSFGVGNGLRYAQAILVMLCVPTSLLLLRGSAFMMRDVEA
jgi:MFS family permease